MNSSRFKRFYWAIKHQLMSRHFYAITSPMRTLPNFIIIGAMKSGSTSLYNYICEHPCILPAAYDEIGFFDSNFHLGLNWYRSMFPTKKQLDAVRRKEGAAITGEDTPFYFWNKDARDRIQKLLPDVKLVLILRNPVDRAFSEYNNVIRGKGVNFSFEEYIKSDLENIKNNPLNVVQCGKKNAIISRGIYFIQLKMWQELFPHDQIFILDTNELSQKPIKTMNDVFKFLELPGHNLQRKFQSKKFVYDKMNDDTRKKLIELYRPYNAKLYKIINRTLDWEK